jgi:hypothetical protein
MFVPQNSGSQTAPEPQLHQDGEGGHNQANVIQGNDNKINLPDGKDEVAELIEILELRRKEVNHTIDANIINLPKSDAEFMLQFQRRFNNLIDDLLKAETHHQFILAHEINIKIHQLGFEITQTKNRIYELVGKEMSTKCPSVFCFENNTEVKSIDAISISFENMTDLLTEKVK